MAHTSTHTAGTATATAPTDKFDWRAEFAYTAGCKPSSTVFPYIYNAKLRHDWVTKKQDPDIVPYAAVNQFWHAARLLDAGFRAGGCPSTDSLYSFAWLDLRKQPIILSHPDMGERYFTFQLAAFTSDNFGYVGQRTTGSAAGDFAIVGPGWEVRFRPGCSGWTRPHPVGARAGSYRGQPGPRTSGMPEVCRSSSGSPAQRLGRPRGDAPDGGMCTRRLRCRRTHWARGRRSTRCWPRTRRRPSMRLLLDQFRGLGVGPGLDVEAAAGRRSGRA